MNPFARLPSVRWPLSSAEAALALLVVGARLTVFAYAGSPLPYYDQWLAEFNNLYLGIFTGQNFAALFDYHNEHWIVTTKLLSLLGFLLNGYWDVSFLIMCSALVRAATAVWTLRLIATPGDRRLQGALWIVCAGFFALPFSGYNLLSGMQVSFFLADAALLWSLHTLKHWRRAGPDGLALLVGMVAGVASMGSAIAIPAATLITHLAQKRARPGFWPAWSATVVIAASYTWIRVSAHAARAENSWEEALHFWLQILAWPSGLAAIGILVTGGAVGILFRQRRTDGPADEAAATLLGLGVYAAANAALLAVARAPGSLHMRHWDTIGWVAFAVLALCLHGIARLQWRRGPVLAATVVGLAYGGALAQLLFTVTMPYLRSSHGTRSAAVAHYRALLLTGDLRVEAARVNALLENKDLGFFDDAFGRHNLHPIVLLNLRDQHRRPVALLAPELIPARPPSLLSRGLRVLIDRSWVLGIGGVAWGAISLGRRHSLTAPASPPA